MRTAIAALALVALPAAATAQTKTCITVQGGRVTCVESYESHVERIERRTRELPDAPPEPPADTQPTPYLSPAERRLVAAVAREIQRGRCDKAETLALKAGDKALAAAAVLRCVPTAIQPGG